MEVNRCLIGCTFFLRPMISGVTRKILISCTRKILKQTHLVVPSGPGKVHNITFPLADRYIFTNSGVMH